MWAKLSLFINNCSVMLLYLLFFLDLVDFLKYNKSIIINK